MANLPLDSRFCDFALAESMADVFDLGVPGEAALASEDLRLNAVSASKMHSLYIDII